MVIGRHSDRKLLVGALLVGLSFAFVLTGSVQRLLVNSSPISFSFATAGDIGATKGTTAALQLLSSSGTNFYLALGDLSYNDITPESAWCNYVHSYVGSSYPFELISGNHENNGYNGFIDKFASCMPDHIGNIIGSGLCASRNASLGAGGCYGAEYYFDFPSSTPVARVILVAAQLTIDNVAYYYYRGNAHYNWLSNTIDDARAKGIPWVIVGFHKPCLSIGTKTCESGPDLMNLLIDKRVDLVLNGHDHNYQRSKQLTCADTPTSSHDAVYVPSCVANDGSSGSYQRGAGTIFVTQGIGGQGTYAINSTDPESGYFAKSGYGTDGFMRYTIAANGISAQLMAAAGGTLSDSFNIIGGSTSPTPQPYFSWSPTSPRVTQTVTFYASVVGGTSPYSFTWNFGDLTTGTGSTVTHAYSKARAYNVTVSSTDAKGVVDKAQNTVTVINATIASKYPPVVPVQQYWGTFYYPWYDNTPWRNWNDMGHSPPSTWASMYLPDDGSGIYNPSSELYSSIATSTIDRHLRWMDGAGFNLALVSWWGQSNFEDSAFSSMLTRAQLNSSLNLKLAIFYEPEGFSDPATSQIVSDLTYIYDHYSSSSAYFKVSNGTVSYPAVFVYAGPSDATNYTLRWSNARSQMYASGKPMFLSLKVWSTPTQDYTSYASYVDSWFQYAPSLRYDLQSGFSAMASPGYWEYPELAISRGHCTSPCSGGYVALDRNSTAFESAVSTMATLTPNEAQFLLVETFNEWHEGTAIEPAFPINHIESGFSKAGPSYGLEYVDIVHGRGEFEKGPLISAPSNETVAEGVLLSFTVTAAGQAGSLDVVTLNASGVPVGATFEPVESIGSVTGTFTWLPTLGEAGSYYVIFQATVKQLVPVSSSKAILVTVLPNRSSGGCLTCGLLSALAHVPVVIWILSIGIAAGLTVSLATLYIRTRSRIDRLRHDQGAS